MLEKFRANVLKLFIIANLLFIEFQTIKYSTR